METTTVYQYKHFMKHLTRIATLMALTLSLATSTMAEMTSQPNAIEKDTVVKKFREYIDTVPDLIEQNSTRTVFKNFLELNNIVEDSIVDSSHPGLSKDSIIKKYRDEMLSILVKKLDQITEKPKEEPTVESHAQWFLKQWKWTASIAGMLLALLLFILWARGRKKRKKAYEETLTKATASNSEDPGFVVRRKTTSIMQKQSLDDVYNNGNYLVINCAEFCADSAVTKIYIKNTCIIGIYNMYAEDLRNPDNPKEDGCMVLGRWVHDERRDEYAVSLEEVILPGDDAIFSEYNLNFGGNIKANVMKTLKKLRRETELQYDLTCWVHSHPGLGVFFSNNDNNVHLIHKHPTHPKFLTAIVIDILTPEQELGIFTFKHDESINSKNDLKKMYSLVEWYKWALGSKRDNKRNSFRSEDQYNTLAEAKSHTNECYCTELTNGIVVDMEKMTALEKRELVYFVHGFTNNDANRISCVAVQIDQAESIPDFDLVGCFVVVTNFSLPSIMKAVASLLGRIKFVLAYSSDDGLLTTIPVVNNDLCTDESYYGKQQLEDLLIWTRRKR